MRSTPCHKDPPYCEWKCTLEPSGYVYTLDDACVRSQIIHSFIMHRTWKQKVRRWTRCIVVGHVLDRELRFAKGFSKSYGKYSVYLCQSCWLLVLVNDNDGLAKGWSYGR